MCSLSACPPVNIQSKNLPIHGFTAPALQPSTSFHSLVPITPGSEPPSLDRAPPALKAAALTALPTSPGGPPQLKRTLLVYLSYPSDAAAKAGRSSLFIFSWVNIMKIALHPSNASSRCFWVEMLQLRICGSWPCWVSSACCLLSPTPAAALWCVSHVNYSRRLARTCWFLCVAARLLRKPLTLAPAFLSVFQAWKCRLFPVTQAVSPLGAFSRYPQRPTPHSSPSLDHASAGSLTLQTIPRLQGPDQYRPPLESALILSKSRHLLSLLFPHTIFQTQDFSTCVCAHVLSHVRLFATPWTVPHQAPLPMGFPRQE